MINKRDIQTLVDCEDYLYTILVSQNADKDKDGDDELASKEYDLFCRYNTLVEKVIQFHDEITKLNRARINERRKTNKFYARSKEEIERMKRVENEKSGNCE